MLKNSLFWRLGGGGGGGGGGGLEWYEPLKMFGEIHVTELSIALIFIILIHHVV